MTSILFFYNIGDHFSVNTNEETTITTLATTTTTTETETETIAVATTAPSSSSLTEPLIQSEKQSRGMFKTILHTFSTLNLKDRSWTDEAQSYLSTVIREMVIQILTDHIQRALDIQMELHKDTSFDDIEKIKEVVNNNKNYTAQPIELVSSEHGDDFSKSSLFGSRFMAIVIIMTAIC